jgi:hypothetical protein
LAEPELVIPELGSKIPFFRAGVRAITWWFFRIPHNHPIRDCGDLWLTE